MKICTGCNEERALAMFSKREVSKDGLSHKCRDCRSDLGKIHYLNNVEKYKEVATKWAKFNVDKRASISNAYYCRNKDKAMEATNRWRRENRPAANAIDSKRRAKKMSATPSWIDNRLVKDMYMEASYQGMQVDHIVPLVSDKVCGLHWEGNLQLLTAKDNQSKGNRYWEGM